MTPVKSGPRRPARRPLQREPDAGPSAGLGLHHDTGQGHPAQDWSAIEVGSTVSVTAATAKARKPACVNHGVSVDVAGHEWFGVEPAR